MPLHLRLTEVRSVVKHVGKNLVLAIPGTRRLRRELLGSAHWSGTYDKDWTARRTRQLRELLDAYAEAWGDWSWLGGKTTLEIGSGPDLAVPFILQTLGAGMSYGSDPEPCGAVAIPDHAVAVFQELASAYVSPSSIRPGAHQANPGIRTASPVYVEKLHQTFAPDSIDLVLSTCTLQHVVDPVIAIEEMGTVLRSGGRMIHTIAIGNHCCARGEADPLHHLFYEKWLWQAMFSQRVGHNRWQWFEWREALEGAGFLMDYVRVTARVESNYVREIRPRLAKRFRAMGPEALEPLYVIVACRKAGEAARRRSSKDRDTAETPPGPT